MRSEGWSPPIGARAGLMTPTAQAIAAVRRNGMEATRCMAGFFMSAPDSVDVFQERRTLSWNIFILSLPYGWD